MTVTVADMLRLLERIAPADLAEEWDNPGLQVGGRDWPVKKVWVALDPLPEVVSAACADGADLLVTHHPLLFRPVRSIDVTAPAGRILEEAITRRLAVVAAHTNLDSAGGGLNDLLAGRIGLENISSLTRPASGDDPPPPAGGAIRGIGRVGNLENPRRLVDLAGDFKKQMGLSAVRYAGDPEMAVNTVAICTGSGASLMKDFFASGADVFVSGDLRYHDARDVEMAGRGMIDIGHFGSEHFMVDAVADRIRAILAEEALSVAVVACRLEKDPFHLL